MTLQFRFLPGFFIHKIIPFCATAYIERGTEDLTFEDCKIYFTDTPSMFRMSTTLHQTSNIDLAQIIPLIEQKAIIPKSVGQFLNLLVLSRLLWLKYSQTLGLVTTRLALGSVRAF